MSTSPRMLAGFIQSSLEAIEGMDAALGREVRARLKPETREAIESASAISLVSVDLDVELTECFFAVAGPARARAALRESIWEIPLPVVVLGGIYSGAFALSEAAAVTALYVLVVEVGVRREIPLARLPAVMRESMVMVGGILIILGVSLA